MEKRVGAEYGKAVLFAVAAAILYACSVPLSKLLLGGIPPVLMAGFLYLGAGVGAGAILFLSGRTAQRQSSRVFERKDLRFLASIVLLDVLAPIFLLSGLARTTAANASLLSNFEIVATALIARLLFQERVSRRLWLALMLVTVASCLLTFEREGGLRFSAGSVYVLCAAACWGLENNCTRKLSSKNPLSVVLVKGTGSGTCSLTIALALGQRASSGTIVLLALTAGFFTFGLSIACYIRAQRTLGAAKTSAYYAAAPFIGAALSFFVLGEQPNAAFYAALVLMGVGAYVASADLPISKQSAE